MCMDTALEAEGIVFREDELVDAKRYGWDPTHDLTQEALKHILNDASNTPIKPSERLLYLMQTDPASPLRGQPSS
jgi:hypothetical protein